MERAGDDGYLETAQVCNLLGIHRSTLWRLVREGRLRQYSVAWSKHPRYRAEEVRALKEGSLPEEEAPVPAWAERALEAVWVLDAEGRVRFANPTAARLLGRPVSGQIGQPFAGALAPESLAPALAALERAVSGRPARLPSLALRDARGEVARRDATFTPILEQGESPTVLVLARDLTSDQEAAGATSLARQAVHSAPVGVLIADAAGVTRAANPAAGALLSASPEALVGQRLEAFWAVTNPIGTPEALHRSALAGGWKGELRARSLDGGPERWTRVVAAAIWDEGRVAGLVILIEPWEEERQREQERLAAAQLQGAVRALQALEGPLTARIQALDGNLRLLRMSLGSAEGMVLHGFEGALAACEELLGLARSLWAEAGVTPPDGLKGVAPGRRSVL